MLKNIGNIFEKRKRTIIRTESKTGEIKKSLQDFMKNRFGDSLAGFAFKINYDSKNSSLTINTGSKVLANEITLLLADIYEHLKRNGITIGSILIR